LVIDGKNFVIRTHIDPQEEQVWQALQRDVVGLSLNSVLISATRSGQDIQHEQADLVIAWIKQALT
jgi:hypothetical protein